MQKRLQEAEYWKNFEAQQEAKNLTPEQKHIDDIFKAFGVTLAESEIEPEEESQVILTIEEQREVAIKVVIGIFVTLAVGLLIAYIHEQMSKDEKPNAQKMQSNTVM